MAGGWRVGDDPSRTAELYTAPYSAFVPTGNMQLGRRYQAAALLPDGTVLIAGGLNGANSAETYDPSSDSFTSTANNMSEYRNLPTATLVDNTETSADGQVLIAGGVELGTGATAGRGLDLYNPATRSFTTVGQLTTARAGLTATLF